MMEDKEENITKGRDLEEEIREKISIEGQNKQLKRVLVAVGVLFLFVFVWLIVVDSMTNFEYRGITFHAIKEGNIKFWNLALPVFDKQGNHIANYNIYLRNDPRKLRKIPIEGGIEIKDFMALDFEDSFRCDGKGVIATANFIKFFDVLGTKVISDEDAGCDEQGRYNFIRFLEGNKTSIKKVGPACYDFTIKDCEILEVTERFMIGALAQQKGYST